MTLKKDMATKKKGGKETEPATRSTVNGKKDHSQDNTREIERETSWRKADKV
jgi:hypothetical protein